MLCYVEVSGVFSSVVVAVADERCLPMVMKVGIGNSYPFGCVSDVDKSVVVILPVSQIGIKFAVVDPNVSRCLNSNAISVCREDVLADDVANNHIGLLPDEQSNTDKFYKKVRSLASNGCGKYILAPGSPMMDLFEPILTCTAPVIVPEMTMTLAVVSSFFALFATAVN
jgi:hypothetical protein